MSDPDPRGGVTAGSLEHRAKAVDYLFDAVVVTDLNGIVVDWNPGAERLYGWSRDEILSQHVSVLHVPEDVERMTRQVFDGIAREGRWHGEIRMLHKSGRIGYIESIVVPVTDDSGATVGAIGVNRDISERMRVKERLEHMAFHDPLTGVGNRLLAMEHLRHAIEAARREGHRVAAIYIDLDDFKSINDDLGHTAGDIVLEEVGRRLEAVTRAADIVARIGGDEFLVVTEKVTTEDEAREVAARVATTLLQPHRIGDDEHVVGVSMGLALYPDHAGDADELLTRADDAMYRSKKNRPSRRHARTDASS